MGLYLKKENSSFKMLGWLFFLNWTGTLAISLLLKLRSKKIGAFISSIKFLSPEVALYLNKSAMYKIILSCLAGAPSCYSELLDKLQKRICRIADPSLAAFLESLAHRRNIASLSLFFRYWFGLNRLNWFVILRKQLNKLKAAHVLNSSIHHHLLILTAILILILGHTIF